MTGGDPQYQLHCLNHRNHTQCSRQNNKTREEAPEKVLMFCKSPILIAPTPMFVHHCVKSLGCANMGPRLHAKCTRGHVLDAATVCLHCNSLSTARILQAQLYIAPQEKKKKVSACNLIALTPLQAHMSHHPLNIHAISGSPETSQSTRPRLQRGA